MSGALEMWGGVECSIVRIHETTRNQLIDTGHIHRIADLDLIAELGITTLRYPVLWEMVERTPGCFDWSWPDMRLQRLRELGIRPIAGLVHHGSGPAPVHVLDPDFPALLAAYAERVAQRYPWIDWFTPVNEPLTTARISGLYGLWNPHGNNEACCLQLTVAYCLAIAKAMTAIRKHTPTARLVQTEDIGRVFATAPLAYQGDHENERRWLALDLLTGRVDRQHPFYRLLLKAGVDRSHLAELAAEPCQPDIVGIDYYLTSDRMLDDRVEQYPDEQIGGNGIDVYVDIAAVRSHVRDETGLEFRINELWDRYQLPIAVTELHNGSTRDEQLRWLVEGWAASQAAKDSGVDVRAVTAWSLFGAVDWNSMLVRRDAYYESGAFDIRGDAPRPTAIAKAIAGFAQQGSFDHPVLDRSGWWRSEPTPATSRRPLLLVGFGRLISIIEECCTIRRLTACAARPAEVEHLLATSTAWAAIRIEDNSSPALSASTVYLQCQFADGGQLFLQCAAWLGSSAVANAFLDLVIDGQRGRFELLCAGADNQYEMAVLPNGSLEAQQIRLAV
ncbi:dTDP-4-dehydrorhamnose reductase (fragment) [Mesorhizobium metallidurans STM 2683]|uniref:dTDP-4-dehydrorhamnose reductase n=1 Tax=Mesorhizobium metallidurans STM 2683 TaxID=1297569 RepID=M5F1F6_9HYPH